MAASNVSQGAYVSGQVHDLGLEARLGMQAQAGPVWPPRGALADGGLPEHAVLCVDAPHHKLDVIADGHVMIMAVRVQEHA